jgi:hypothetical protein
LKSTRSQHDNSNLIDETDPVKRTASLISLPTKGLPHSPSDQTANGSFCSAAPKLKTLQHRHLQRIHQRQRIENEQWNNHPPPIISMPPLMEFQRHLSHSASTIDNDTTLNDTHFDCTPPLRSLPRREPPILHSKMPHENLKRIIEQKPLNSIESAIKERSIRLAQENLNQSITVPRINQGFKKQLYLPFNKK